MTIHTRDQNVFWHPCSQMKDYETFKPLNIKSAKGALIETESGQHLIDAISSWWCKPLGHGHPRLKQALIKQADKFEHVIAANTTHETIVALSEKCAALTDSLDKVFYASDGSCAIEIAIKMSLHSRINRGQKTKKRFVSLENSYHGETIMTLAVSDTGLYKKPYASLYPKTHVLHNIPYVSSSEDTEWHDAKRAFKKTIRKIAPIAHTLSGIVIEPILQGAGGMKIYSQDFLRLLRVWCDEHDIHLIADEIMTGFGRTGKMLACEHAGIEPDFLCLGKGLTAGWLPMSAVVTSNEIYEQFYDDYRTGKAFMHSHTHTGNALCAAIALEAFSVYDDENIPHKAAQLEKDMRAHFGTIAKITDAITNVRAIGGMAACDLKPIIGHPRLGYEIYQEAVKLGALLRPLGNTLYWLPPLNISKDELAQLAEITERAIVNTLHKLPQKGRISHKISNAQTCGS